MIEYQLIRSKRRTLSISINGEGAVVVRAPMRLGQREIEAFLLEKQGWIDQKQALMRQAAANRQQGQLVEGAQIPFWGACLTVRFETVSKAFHQEGMLVLPDTPNRLQEALQWRRRCAERLLAPRVEMWSRRTGWTPQKVSYGNAGSRWGSMSTKGSMRLNTALVHLPPEMADYVIVHELAHLQHPNHSAAFHACVRTVLPEADRIRQQMKRWAYVTTLWK